MSSATQPDDSVKSLADRLQAEFNSVHQRCVDQPAWWRRLFRTVDANGAYEILHGFNATPIPQAWVMRNKNNAENSSGLTKSIYAYDYELTLEWTDRDENDERVVDSLISRVRDGASRLANLDEMALYDLINGRALYLHPSTDFNCYDSLPLYSASHAARRGGNTIIGSGMIKTDWSNVLQAFREMCDIQNQPSWRDMLDQAHFIVVAPPQLEEDMTSAFAVVPKEGRPELVIWERLSVHDNSWYVFLVDIGEAHTFIKLDRQTLRFREWNFENSDWAARTKIKGAGWDIRAGFGALNFHTTVRVDN